MMRKEVCISHFRTALNLNKQTERMMAIFAVQWRNLRKPSVPSETRKKNKQFMAAEVGVL